jgi:hypothetical protein
LGRTPDLYIGSAYLFAHLHESMLIILSNPSLVSVHVALLTLNFMLPLAFYVMTKAYLERIDVRLPSISTIFWVLFTNNLGGFAWVYFINLKLSLPNQTQIQLLTAAADKTYNGIVYGVLGLWYVPATISLVALMASILLMSKKDIPAPRYTALFSVVIATLYLTHVVEATILALFIAIYNVFLKNANFKIYATLKASIIGFILAGGVYYIFSQLTARFIFDLSFFFSFVLPILALSFSLITRKFARPRFPFIKFRCSVNSKLIAKSVILLLLFVYSAAFLVWVFFSLTNAFHHLQFVNVGVIPWFMYPVVLGLNGLLGMVALYVILCDKRFHRWWRNIAFFLGFAILMFAFGKFITLLNISLFDTHFWEHRFISFMKIGIAPLAPITTLFLIDRLKRGNLNNRTVTSVIIIGTLVVYGASTTFLNVEYWHIKSNTSKNFVTPDEMEAITALKEIFDNDPRAWLVVLSGMSKNTATFAAPPDIAGTVYSYKLSRPEVAYAFLYRAPIYSHPYIYIHDRDAQYLTKFSNGFLAHYLPTLPTVFNGSTVKIYRAPKSSFPQSDSNSVLVLPFDNFLDDDEFYIPYYLLSHGFYDYGVRYDLDEEALRSNTIVLSFDPPKENFIEEVFNESFDTINKWTVKQGKWEISNGLLIGGREAEGTGIILSPISSEDFTASVRCKASMEPNTSNYTYGDILYSWLDPYNYRLAGAYFSPDGYIYVRIIDYVDGKGTAIPSWPGINTKLKWSPLEEYNLTVTVNGTLTQIYINGRLYLSEDLTVRKGLIGLRYLNTKYSMTYFDDFSLRTCQVLKTRNIDSYLSYLNDGGRLIVLNTNGYGYFAQMLFNISTSLIPCDKLRGSNVTALPMNITVPLLIPRIDVAPISEYSSPTGGSPFVVEKDFGKGKLLYVNIHPIVKAMAFPTSKSMFHELIGELLNDVCLQKLDPNTRFTFDAFVKEISARKNVEVRTHSIIFPTEMDIKQFDIETETDFYTFHDVKHIEIKGSSNLTIGVNNVLISNGHGFYSNLAINSTFTIVSSEGFMDIVVTTDMEEITLKEASRITVAPRNLVQLVVRMPTVIAEEVMFMEFYPEGSLKSLTRTYGQNLKVIGETEFMVILSDSYSVIKNVTLGTSFQQDPQPLAFDEFSTIPTFILYVLLLVLLVIGITTLVMSEKAVNTEFERLKQAKKHKCTF